MSLADASHNRLESRPEIALAIDVYDWHARALIKAFGRLGARATPVRLSQCIFDTRRPGALVIPGFGTFESVTLRLGILHSLAALGVPVVNSARCVEICADKSAASFAFASNNIPTPPTWVAESALAARRIVRREAKRGPLVFKPLFGAQGYGLKLILSEDDLPSFEEACGVYYLQRFVGGQGGGFSDFRVLVSNGEVIAAMIRHGKQWVTNIKLGARPEWIVPDADMRAIALRAAASVGAVVAGVDIIRSLAGPVQVLEVNSMPGWRGLQSVAPFSIADLLAEHFLAKIAWPGSKAAE